MGKLYDCLRSIIDNQNVQLVSGLLLIFFTVVSIFTDFLELHHAVLALALANAVPNLVQGFERIARGIKNVNKSKGSR